MIDVPTNPNPHSPIEPAADAPKSAQAPRAAVSNVRFAVAMAVALLADTVGVPLGEVGIVVFDVAVGLVLALCLRGFRPEIIVACLIEAIPGVGLFPSWSLAVPAIWARMKLGAAGAAATGPDRGSNPPR